MKEDNVYIIIITCLFFINLYSFVLYWKDKSLAKKNGWRIPEAKLFLVALLGGSFGAILGMKAFSHKTKKASFRIGLPFLLIANIIFLYYLITFFG